jgi:hypothetical protein
MVEAEEIEQVMKELDLDQLYRQRVGQTKRSKSSQNFYSVNRFFESESVRIFFFRGRTEILMEWRRRGGNS